MTINNMAEKDIGRWKTGHRAFFVTIQTLTLALMQFEDEPSEHRLDQITDLLAGSGGLMEYSADFVSGDYSDVRNSMADLDPDFSGTFSADHAAMIKAFPVLRSYRDKFPDAFDAFQMTLEQVYAAHAYICRRFVGEGGSLANDKQPGWRIVYTKLSRRALEKAGIHNSRMPRKLMGGM